MKDQNSFIRGAFYGITAAAIWGGMYVVSDEVLRIIPPFSLLTLRLSIGAAILGAILLWHGEIKVAIGDALRLLGVGVVGFGISLGAQFIGTRDAGGLNGSIVTSASPAFILFFAWLLLREPLTLERIGAIVFASLGVLLVFDFNLDLSSSILQGNIALVVAALTWALYSVLVKLVSKNYQTLTISFYALLGGLLVSIPTGVIELGTKPVGVITIGIMLGVLYLGVISTALAMVLWNRAFALVEASIASLFFFAQPLVGILLSTLVQKRIFTLGLMAGSVLIISGVLLSMLRRGTSDQTV